jgi:hypothetical protein
MRKVLHHGILNFVFVFALLFAFCLCLPFAKAKEPYLPLDGKVTKEA